MKLIFQWAFAIEYLVAKIWQFSVVEGFWTGLGNFKYNKPIFVDNYFLGPHKMKMSHYFSVFVSLRNLGLFWFLKTPLLILNYSQLKLGTFDDPPPLFGLIPKFRWFFDWKASLSDNTFVDFHFHFITKLPKRPLKSLCYNSLKKKNVFGPNFLSVRADCSGIWLFFWRHYPRVVNWLST